MSNVHNNQKSETSHVALLQAVTAPTTVGNLQAIVREALPQAPEDGRMLRAVDRARTSDLPAILEHLQHDADKSVALAPGYCRQRVAEVLNRVEHHLPSALQQIIRAKGLDKACAELEETAVSLRNMVAQTASATEEASIAAQDALSNLQKRRREFMEAKAWRMALGILPVPPSRRRLRRIVRLAMEATRVWTCARLKQEAAGAAHDLSVTLAEHFQRRATLHAVQRGLVVAVATSSVPVDNAAEILSAISEMQPSQEWVERTSRKLVAARADEVRNVGAERLAAGHDGAMVINDLAERLLADAPLPFNAAQFLKDAEPDVPNALARRERLADQQALREPFAQAGLKRREVRLIEVPEASNGSSFVEAYRRINPNGAFTLEADSTDPREIRIYKEERGLAVNAFKSFRIARAIARATRPADLLPMLTVVDDPRELLVLNPDDDPMSELALLVLGDACSRGGDNSYWVKTCPDGASARAARGLSDMLAKIGSNDEAIETGLALARKAVSSAGHDGVRQRMAGILRRASDFVPASDAGSFREAIRQVAARILAGEGLQLDSGGELYSGGTECTVGSTRSNSNSNRRARPRRNEDFSPADGNGSVRRDGLVSVDNTCRRHTEMGGEE